MNPAARAPVGRVPVTLLTGFLGSGKTTLLNHWVRQPEMAGAAVLVNEFGEVGIDHHLVDTLDDQVVLLDSGCLCCAVRGDLVGALKNLAARSARREVAPISRVVIETSGLADPVPVITTLMEDAFVAARYVCDGVVTVVSASHGAEQLRAFPEALRQVLAADLLLITKGDRASSLALSQLQDSLRELNPSAPQHLVRHGGINADVLRSCGVYDAGLTAVTGRVSGSVVGGSSGDTPGGPPRADDDPPRIAQWLGAEALRLADLQRAVPGAAAPDAVHAAAAAEPTDTTDTTDANDATDAGRSLGAVLRGERGHAARRVSTPHAPGVSSFVMTFAQPVPWLGFAVAFGHMLAEHGAQLLRVKGLMQVVGAQQPQVIQCVQGVAYPSIRLGAWPHDGPFRDGCGRLVFITRDLTVAQGESIRAALSQWPTDNAALRMSAGDMNLPTRCWLAQRLPAAAASAVTHDGWHVQTRRFSGGR